MSWLIGSPLVNLPFLGCDNILECGGVNSHSACLWFYCKTNLEPGYMGPDYSLSEPSQIIPDALLVGCKVQDARGKKETT